MIFLEFDMDYDVVVIGAGVVGLAIAMNLAQKKYRVLVIEKNEKFGQETSSRNSEVIHAGLYYPKDSLKTQLCIKGNELLYDFCKKNNIDYVKIGKFVIAIENDEIEKLESVYQNAKNNGVSGLKRISINQFQKIEPNINAKEVFFSGNTGIINTHQLMYVLENLASNWACDFAYNHELIGLNKSQNDWNLAVKTLDNDIFEITTNFVINCAGLNSSKIAEMAGINTKNEDLDIKYCKGNYFKINNKASNFVNHLIYPVTNGNHGLGIHLTIDLNNGMKLGPDTEYLENNELDYNVNDLLVYKFFEAGKRYLKNLKIDDLNVDYCGIRPKIQRKEQKFRDFYIQNEKLRNLNGLINLIGIESPGLTACIAIADYVGDLIN